MWINWDSGAWKDRFAQAAFTTRQQQLTYTGGRACGVHAGDFRRRAASCVGWSNDASFESRIQQLNSENPTRRHPH